MKRADFYSRLLYAFVFGFAALTTLVVIFLPLEWS